MTHHYYISFVCGSAFGGIGIETRAPLNTAERISQAAADIGLSIARQRGGQAPPVVVLNIIPVQAPSPIIELPAGATLQENGGRR